MAPPVLSSKPSWKEMFTALPFALGFVYRSKPSLFIASVLLSVLSFPVALVSVIGVRGLTDALLASSSSLAWTWGGVLVGVSFLGVAISSLREWFTDLQRYRTEIALDEEEIKHVIALPYATIESPDFQALSSAYRRKSHVVINLQTNGIRSLENLMAVLGLLGGFTILPWPVAVLSVLSLVATVVLFVRFTEFHWNILTADTREGRRANYYQGVLTQPTSTLQARALGLEKSFLHRWQGIAERLFKLRRGASVRSGRVVLVGGSLQVAGQAIGLLLLIPSALAGVVTLSAFVVFLTTYQRMASTLENFSWQFGFLLQESSFLSVFKRFYAVSHEQDAGKALPRGPLEIRYEDVWFRYPGTDVDVVRGLNLTFTEGEHLAFVGLNGAGKTTLFKLLMGVYTPTRGRILVNGVNLQDIRPAVWRRTLAVLTQGDTYYDDTLEEQVLYGQYAEKKRPTRFRRSLEVSGLKEMASVFPRGLQTHAGKAYAMPEDQAIELSGGQKQIVAIARTLYREARFYIFDEPTSAVDAEKEERFFAQLPEMLSGQGIIFVSHRFSTLRRGAERIVVIDQGRVIEDGTHAELLERKGRYAELFALQAEPYQYSV